MSLPAAPEKLIAPNGLPFFGVYEGTIRKLNWADYDFSLIRRGVLSKIGPIAKMYLKRWHYIGIIHPSFTLGAACVDLNYIGNAFFYLYERSSRQMNQFETILPAAMKINMAESAESGQTSVQTKGFSSVFDNGAKPIRVNMNIKNRLSASLLLHTDDSVPISCITRIGLGGFNYTHKLAGIPASGEVSIDGRRLDATGSWAVIDFTLGIPARETFWNWAAGGGKSDSGKTFGLNFAAGINETGFTENVFWLDGKPHKADAVHFDYDRKDLMSPWRILSSDGKVDLVFHPEGKRSAKINALVIASMFHQPFGTFKGVLRSDDGVENITEGYGYVEEHMSRW